MNTEFVSWKTEQKKIHRVKYIHSRRGKWREDIRKRIVSTDNGARRFSVCVSGASEGKDRMGLK